MYTFVFPLTIFTFICTMILRKKIISYLIIVIVFTAFGLGIKMCQVMWAAGLPILLISLIIIVFIIYKIVKIDKEDFFVMEDNSVGLDFSFTALWTWFIMYVLMIPISAERLVISLTLFIVIIISLIIIPLAEGCFGCCNKCRGNYDAMENACLKSLSFANHLLPLLIIPSTESFFSLIQDDKITIWNLVLGYVVISLLFPIFLNIIMVISNSPDLASKYKQTNDSLNKYYFFEIGDIGKQIIYSICAEYNAIWGCVFVEVAWVVLVLIFRPYKMISEYFITILNSIVITFSNSVILYSNYHYLSKFSFKSTIIAVAIICFPAIISIYVYFIKDFHPNDDESDEEKEEHVLFLSTIIIYIAPIIWYFYGLSAWTTYTGV